MKPEECKDGCPPNQACDYCQFGEWKYITDPEELFRLKREGWVIEVRRGILPLEKWTGVDWERWWTFRARPPQPKMKKIKMLCWLTASNRLVWEVAGCSKSYGWVRILSEDKEIEVPE